jgi:DNA-binding transcriptional MerR regulator
MTLFGEEIIQDAPKPAPKTRAKKGDNDAQTEDANSLQETHSETEQEIKQTASEDITTTAEKPDFLTETAATASFIDVTVGAVLEESESLHEETKSAAENALEDIIAITNLPDSLRADEATSITSPVTIEPVIATTETEVPNSTTEVEDILIPTPKQSNAVPEKTKRKTEKKTKITDEYSDEEITDGGAVIAEDWKGEKQYYSIGEVAGFFKVKTSHIRFWTNEFKLKVRTTRKGDRLFTADQVKEIRTIYHLVKERGFTLSGAKSKLNNQNKRDVTTIDLKTSLLHLKNKLVILRNELG